MEDRTLLTAYVVDTLADTVAADGKLSLREAIQAANDNAAFNEAAAGQGGGVTDTISFADAITAARSPMIGLGGTQLVITDHLKIAYLGETELVISGEDRSRVFSTQGGTTVELVGLGIYYGRSAIGAGGIHAGGTLTLIDCDVRSNSAEGNGGGIGSFQRDGITLIRTNVSNNSARYGGGIYIIEGGLTLIDSTVARNTADEDGGGVFSYGGVLTVFGSTFYLNSATRGGGIFSRLDKFTATNSTLFNNVAGSHGGGIFVNDGTATLRNVTVFDNRADVDADGTGGGGGIFVDAGQPLLHNTIVAANFAGNPSPTERRADDVAGTLAADSSHNLFDIGGSGGLEDGVQGNLVGINGSTVLVRHIPELFGPNGGPTVTLAVIRNSAAVDAGDNAQALDLQGRPLTADQRGAARVFGGNVDIGAYERIQTVVVDTLVDELDGDPSAGDVSLREAVEFVVSGGTVTFAPSLAGGTIELKLGTISTSRSVTINGLGASALTIDGNGNRVFGISKLSRMASPAPGLTIRGLTITGGGITVWQAGLMVVECALVDNVAPLPGPNSSGTTGGAIESFDGHLTIVDSTLSGNSADRGGAIMSWLPTSMTILNSTISGNRASGDGGGIYTDGRTTLRNVTIFGNRADADGNGTGSGGGIFNTYSGQLTFFNTLIVGNRRGSGFGTPSDLSGGSHVGSSNYLIGSAAGVLDPVLRDNGGPTKTHALLIGSAAVDAGSDAQALDVAGNPLTTDQRGDGFPRRLGARVDIGAYEGTTNRPPAGPADLVAYHQGDWYVGVSNGTWFETGLAETWANLSWDVLAHGDFNGDHRSDVLGLFDGQWWIGLADGNGAFSTTLWARWADVAWQNVTIGDLNGDGRDDLLARVGGDWWAALSTGSGFTLPTVWSNWNDAAWRNVSLVDLDGDGDADLLAYLAGQWWAALSNGTSFGPASLRDQWANVAWTALGTFDPDADGRADIYGLLGGQWWVGRNDGSGAFVTSLRMQWAPGAWVDPLVGDWNRDGRDDLAARLGGDWWTSLSSDTGGAGATHFFAHWADVAWQDARAADFDGDGRTDLVARFGGQWWLARSTGSDSATSLWDIWADVDWRAVNASDVTGPIVAGGAAPFADRSSLPEISATEDEEPLALFWSTTEEDEELARGLLAAV